MSNSPKAPKTFFIHPCNPMTNKMVSELLGKTCLCEGRVCEDGRRRNLWQCTMEEIGVFEAFQEEKGFEFNIFVANYPLAVPEPWVEQKNPFHKELYPEPEIPAMQKKALWYSRVHLDTARG